MNRTEPPSFSSIDALRHADVNTRELSRHGVLKVAGKEYQIQLKLNGEFIVNRHEGGRTSFFNSASELFSHRLAEGSLSSRSSRIAEVLNEKRTPGERAGYHTPPPFATPARAARNAQPQPTQRPSFATPPRGYRADFTVNTHKASSSGTKKASSAEAGTASTSTGRHANARNPVFAASLKELAKWSEIKQTSIADPRSMQGVNNPDMEKKYLMNAKTLLETRIKASGLKLSDVMVHDDGKTLATNLNHIEFRTFFNRSGGFWDQPADNVARKSDSLIKKADLYFKAFQKENRADPSPLAMPRNNKPLGIIKEILQGDSGLVIGEAHNCVASKRVLIENMKDLKSAGVTTLFMEHLCSDSHGKDLADYLSAPKGTPMPKRLEIYLDTQTREQGGIGGKPSKYGFKELVQAAKEAGINVIPVDTAATYATSTSDGNARYKAMNYYAAEKIRLTQPQGKWIAFVGSGHAARCEGVPGLSELTGTRSMIIDEYGQSSKPKIEVNVKGYLNQINPDIVLSYKKP